MTQESGVCKVDEYGYEMIQCIESIIDRVVNLFTHLRSLHGRFFGGPILGLFLRGSKMGENWSGCKI